MSSIVERAKVPGIATHYAFGAGLCDESLDAFLLGNQGPDPFFYMRAVPVSEELKRIGSTMHRQETVRLLQVMHDRFITSGENASLASYALGFMCHYILDSTVHPLVYAQQYALCNAGIGSLKNKWPHHVAHATIETALDEYTLATKLEATAATMPPHEVMLRCADRDLTCISRACADVIERVYEIACPTWTFEVAVKLYRAAQAVLDSKSKSQARGATTHALATQAHSVLSGLSERLGAAAYMQALSHRGFPLVSTPFANDDHVPWPHPFMEGRVVSESFDNLYDAACDKARKMLPVFVKSRLEEGWLEEIICDIDFCGCSQSALSALGEEKAL